MDWLLPRSTSIHCGSENALDQRVPVFPSVALAAGKLAFSVDDAVVGWCSATFVVPQVAAVAMGAAAGSDSAVRISVAPARARESRRRGGARGMGTAPGLVAPGAGSCPDLQYPDWILVDQAAAGRSVLIRLVDQTC